MENLSEMSKDIVEIFYDEIFSKRYSNKLFEANLKNNFRLIQVDQIKSFPNSVAIYNANSNELYFIKGKLTPNVMFHELIHLATTKKKSSDDIKIGLSVHKNNNIKNIALNEGLTQWLVCKTYNGTDLYNDTYPFETRIAVMLEAIFGEEFLYRPFFNASFNEFVNNVESLFGNDFNIVKLINEMDNYSALFAKSITVGKEHHSVLIQKMVIDMFVKKLELSNNTDFKFEIERFKKLLINGNTGNIILDFISCKTSLGINEIEDYFKAATASYGVDKKK